MSAYVAAAEWCAAGEVLAARAAGWGAIGDWVNARPRGCRVVDAAEILGLSLHSARQYAWLARAVSADSRVPVLGRHYHVAVARLAPVDQRRRLIEAAADGITVTELRRLVAAEGAQ